MHAFRFGLTLGALFNEKLRLGYEGRKGLAKKLESTWPGLIQGRPVAWFHAASLGEFEQGRPVIEAFRAEYPDYFILLTFFSPSGYEIRKNYSGADYICYMPIDTASNARRFVALVNPRITFFIKYEFWFNYLNELQKQGSAIFSFSAIFQPWQHLFKPYGGFYRKMLTCFDHLFVQNEDSRTLLNSIGITQCSVGGDTRFDRVKAIASNPRDLPEIESFIQQSPCLLAGSVWDADMQVLIPALNHFQGTLKAIIAPHEIHSHEIAAWCKLLNGRSILYSEYRHSGFVATADYLIIDNIGMLSSLYRYGHIAYIGGSFGAGLHNILEAATFGLPVVFGNKSHHRFQEALDLISAGGAIAVADDKELIASISKWVDEPAKRIETGRRNAMYVTSQVGATQRIMDKVRTL